MPVNWEKYPKNWKYIAYKVKNNANWTCENCGRICKKPEESWEEFALRLDPSKLEELSQKKIRFVLTVAHLDHDTTRNDFDNLKALCSVCHLRYDAKHHAETRKKKRAI